jgi:phytoene desaturase
LADKTETNRKEIIVIGAGFSGLSAAAYLSAAGHHVKVYEKNGQPGGRARTMVTDNGYRFDMGPSWYWMPDVFERFFRDLGYRVADLYSLRRLDPGFEMIFTNNERLEVPDDFGQLYRRFESIESGSGHRLERFMEEAQYKYEKAMQKLVHMPGLSYSEFADPALLSGMLRLQVFSSFSKHVRKYFTNPKLTALMEFPVLFLGAMPKDTPALYSLMNYAGLKLGTWYPQGGFGKIIDAITGICRKNGVDFHFNSPVTAINISRGLAQAVVANGRTIACDAVISGADYHHTEIDLLPSARRNYAESYWNKRTFAPSCLIYYVGLNKRLSGLKHHTLFFDADIYAHYAAIYEAPAWPEDPLFYVCCPSQTDDTVAPPGHENLFFLMPLAPGLADSESIREKYFQLMLERLQKHVHTDLEPYIDFKQSFCVSNFVTDYNAYKGNAYGLANTLRQTAIWKPKVNNKHVKNLFYTGQLTVPGPGVPPALISGKIAAEQILKYIKSTQHEIAL